MIMYGLWSNFMDVTQLVGIAVLLVILVLVSHIFVIYLLNFTTTLTY